MAPRLRLSRALRPPYLRRRSHLGLRRCRFHHHRRLLRLSFVAVRDSLLPSRNQNPFLKLAPDDFAGDTPLWTTGFLGSVDSYSFPSSSQQARMRIHENVKRFARNYTMLLIVFFACALYQMPLALAGLLATLALWELFKFCSDKWEFDRYPAIRQFLIRVAQCATVVLLTFLNVQMAVFYGFAISYGVMILHAAFEALPFHETIWTEIKLQSMACAFQWRKLSGFGSESDPSDVVDTNNNNAWRMSTLLRIRVDRICMCVYDH